MYNKCDSVSVETLDRMAREGDGRTVMISCELDLGLDWLLETIWRVSFSFLNDDFSGGAMYMKLTGRNWDSSSALLSSVRLQ